MLQAASRELFDTVLDVRVGKRPGDRKAADAVLQGFLHGKLHL